MDLRIHIKQLKNFINKKVSIKGWIKNYRKHSNVFFLDVYDSTGTIQCTIEDKSIKFVRGSCVHIEGTLLHRQEDQINQSLENGDLEINIEHLHVYSSPTVFINDNATEDVQLKHRPIYLHQKRLRDIINMRSDFLHKLRNWMVDLDFQEIQTPILTSSTIEGARDFIIPSRLNPGKFYALPQAPQIFKQLLMIGGIEKYFQIAPCFRDEDARSDRCYGEFYQLDCEMSFVNIDDIENLMRKITKFIGDYAQREYSFQILDYKDAMENYGSDKPDLRYDYCLENYTEFFKQSQFRIFTQQIEKGAIVKAVRCKNITNPNKVLDQTDKIGFKCAYVTKKNNKLVGPIGQFCENIDLEEQETMFFICHKNANSLGGKLIDILKSYEEKNHNKLHFIFIKNMPMFEKDNDNKWQFTHNPFSKPQNPRDPVENIIGFQYDLVCNGYELASGGIRNEDYESLISMFKIAGYTQEQVNNNFSIACALRDYAAPPHGGFAMGIERILMIISQCDSIRNVVAFPLNSAGVCHLMNAPNEVSNEQLAELNIKLNKIVK